MLCLHSIRTVVSTLTGVILSHECLKTLSIQPTNSSSDFSSARSLAAFLSIETCIENWFTAKTTHRFDIHNAFCHLPSSIISPKYIITHRIPLIPRRTRRQWAILKRCLLKYFNTNYVYALTTQVRFCSFFFWKAWIERFFSTSNGKWLTDWLVYTCIAPASMAIGLNFCLYC